MTSDLPRRYRRLLLAYPRPYRRRHGDEILTGGWNAIVGLTAGLLVAALSAALRTGPAQRPDPA